MGEFDFVKQAFEEIGGVLDFWRVAIKPGKPFVCGRKGEKHFFGLPGNPVSAFVTFLLLVRPALLKLQGATETGIPVRHGLLAEPMENPADRRHFIRVRMDTQGRVTSAGVQASHMLLSLAKANALLDLGPKQNLDAGARVAVLSWE